MHNDKTCGQSILTDSPTIHSLSIAPYFLLRPVPSQLSMKIHLRLSSNPDTCKTQLYVYRIVRLSHMHKHALCSRHQYCYELQCSESGHVLHCESCTIRPILYSHFAITCFNYFYSIFTITVVRYPSAPSNSSSPR